MKAWLTSWRLALRLARRDLFKHKARAIIALVMVTLPVLGVVAADVLIQTAQVSPAEGISRRLGTAAAAEVQIADRKHGVQQGADPGQGWGQTDKRLGHPATPTDIGAVIGRRTMLPAPVESDVLVRTAYGREPVIANEVDASAPLARGLYRLSSGHWPTTTGQVVVNQALLDRGVGSTLEIVRRDRTESGRTIVGTFVDATRRTAPMVVGLPGAFRSANSDTKGTWLVDGPPISWSQVTRLNALGVLVTDRQIVTHPDAYPDPLAHSNDRVDDQTVQVAVLIVVMALIEVVLLAGPAFAVGARKQQRSLALLVSAGGTPGQARRVIIAGGLLLGVSAAAMGIVGGIGVAWVLRPVVQRFSAEWFGPFDVTWWHLAGIAAFGLASALIACLVPAWIASRQNVVAVLAGRRGDAKPVRAFPVIGLVLFAAGVLVAVGGARERGDGALTIAWSAVICVLGMVLLVPVLVSWVARLAGRFPLAVRFAARDAVRHRTRTTPAVAAVAATVAGVVALGISTASDEKQNRETYTPNLVIGNATVTPSYDVVGPDPSAPTDWAKVEATVRAHVPGVRIVRVAGIEQSLPRGGFRQVTFSDPAAKHGNGQFWAQTQSAFGSQILVTNGRHLPPTVAAEGGDSPGVTAALAAGRAVVFANVRSQTALDHVRIHVDSSDRHGKVTNGVSVVAPATVIYRDDPRTPAQALVPPAVAREAGLTPTTIALELDRPQLSPTAARNLDAALDDLATPATVSVERGYQATAYATAVQWVLALLAAILMFGGTLTAMFLALSDARPDLATLAAVGATPRTRRSVAAAYTFVVAFVGAVLGMLVGFVPGLAITRPLTRIYGPGGATSYFLDVPWLMIAVVVIGLPVLTALMVGAATRSRLPMVSRLT